MEYGISHHTESDMATVTTCHICAHAWYLWLDPKFSGVSNRLYHVTALKKWLGKLAWNMCSKLTPNSDWFEPRFMFNMFQAHLGWCQLSLPEAQGSTRPSRWNSETFREPTAPWSRWSIGIYAWPFSRLAGTGYQKTWEGKWKITDYLALFIMCYYLFK